MNTHAQAARNIWELEAGRRRGQQPKRHVKTGVLRQATLS